jgi:hypothetical protein
MDWYRRWSAGHSLQVFPASMRLAPLTASRSIKPPRPLSRSSQLAVAFVLPFNVPLGNRTIQTSRRRVREGCRGWSGDRFPDLLPIICVK